MMRRFGLILGCCLAVASFGGPTLAAADGPTATASASCKTPKYPGDGYFTSLSVTKTSCKRGREVTLAHYRCRIKKGKAGRCTVRVLGYSCTERRNSIPTEINGKVTCKRSTAKIVYTYQQNL
jgi:hypothetical protein